MPILEDLPQQSTWTSTTRKIELPPWFHAARRKIDSLSRLPTGWDGYGSPALGRSACETALLFLRSLSVHWLPEPWIGPTADGGIQVEWNLPLRAIELIFRDGEISSVVKIGDWIGQAQLRAEVAADLARAVAAFISAAQ